MTILKQIDHEEFSAKLLYSKHVHRIIALSLWDDRSQKIVLHESSLEALIPILEESLRMIKKAKASGDKV